MCINSSSEPILWDRLESTISMLGHTGTVEPPSAVTPALRPGWEGPELCCISYSIVIWLYSGHLCITYYGHVAPPCYNQLRGMIHRV